MEPSNQKFTEVVELQDFDRNISQKEIEDFLKDSISFFNENRKY